MVSETSLPPSGDSGDEVPENLLFDDPDADIILRSHDNYKFRVLKRVIAQTCHNAILEVFSCRRLLPTVHLLAH